MKRLLSLGVLLSVISAAVMFTTCRPVAPVEVYTTRPAVSPIRYHYSDLPRDVYQGRVHHGQTVVVTYPVRLQPTADPHVFHFHPGSTSLPYTHRVIFSEPQFGLPCPVTVTGAVGGIDTDIQVRHNNMPGGVVIRAASVLPSTP